MMMISDIPLTPIPLLLPSPPSLSYSPHPIPLLLSSPPSLSYSPHPIPLLFPSPPSLSYSPNPHPSLIPLTPIPLLFPSPPSLSYSPHPDPSIIPLTPIPLLFPSPHPSHIAHRHLPHDHLQAINFNYIPERKNKTVEIFKKRNFRTSSDVLKICWQAVRSSHGIMVSKTIVLSKTSVSTIFWYL